MQELATIEQPATPAEHKPTKKRRIPRRIAEVIKLVVTGECSTMKAAAERCGMHPNYVYTAFKKPEIVAHIEQETRAALTRLQAPAAATLARLMTEASSEHVQKDVAIHALAINGHKPKSETQLLSVSLELKAGFVIDISEPSKPIVDVTPAHD